MFKKIKSLVTVLTAFLLCLSFTIVDSEARGGGGRGGGGFRGGGMRAGGGGFRGGGMRAGGMRAGGYRAGGISRGRFAGGGRPAGFARPMGRTGFNRPITERSFGRGGMRPGLRPGGRPGFRPGVRPGMRGRGFRPGYRHYGRTTWNRGWWNRGWGRWPWWSGWGLGLGLGVFPWWWGGSPAWWGYRNPWYWYYWSPEQQSYTIDASTYVLPTQTADDDSNDWLVINSTDQDINAISGDTTIKIAPGAGRLITKSINNRIRITTDSASNLFEVEPDDEQLNVIKTDNQLDIETD